MDISQLNENNLDDFVNWVDNNGGPSILNDVKIQQKFKYHISTIVDTGLEPTSEEYVEQQMQLYREIANRKIDQLVNEQTDFNIEAHSISCNPYNISDPSNFVFHYLRLGHLIQQAGFNPNPNILDMGCGWGLSTEFLGNLGASVTAVDINPKFISLVERRSSKNLYNIKTCVSSFIDFFTVEKYDGILFYECLHHSLDVTRLIEKLKYFLKPGGSIILGGEPIQSMYWDSWGIRLDALSIYCIRKFGWFESGWSEEFIDHAFKRLSFDVNIKLHPEPIIGYTLSAKLSAKIYYATDLGDFLRFENWYIEEHFYICKGNSTIFELKSMISSDTSGLNFCIYNFSSDKIRCNVIIDKKKKNILFNTGHNVMFLNNEELDSDVTFECTTWQPSQKLEDSSDNRIMSFHLFAIEIVK